MKTLYAITIFLFVLATTLSLYTNSYTQFNLAPATTTYTQITQVVNTTSIGISVNQNVSIGQNVVCNNLTLGCSNCPPGGCTNPNQNKVFCATGNLFGILIPNPICAIDCFFNPHDSICGGQNIVVSNAPKLFNANEQSVQQKSNNIWLQIIGSPLDQSLAIMLIFLGLGILAGLMGAGILARVMASVGIGLSVINYIESQTTSFTNLPPLLYIGFNAILGMMLMIIAWESFNSPGGL